MFSVIQQETAIKSHPISQKIRIRLVDKVMISTTLRNKHTIHSQHTKLFFFQTQSGGLSYFSVPFIMAALLIWGHGGIST